MRLLLLVALAIPLYSQTGLVNPDLDQGEPGAVPPGWRATVGVSAWVGEGCRQGKGCVEASPGTSAPAGPGILLQMIDAAPYRGKLIRYRAAVRTAVGGRAGLWLRVDRP